MSNPNDKRLDVVPRGLRIAVAREVARRRMPYFGAGIDAMGFEDVPGLGTMGATEDGRLLVDLDSLAAETPLESATGLLHEYMHLYFDHGARFRRAVKVGLLVDSPDDRRLWNTCGDLEINDGLVEAGLPETFGPHRLITPASLKVPPHLVAEQYVEILKKRRDEQHGGQKVGRADGSIPRVGAGHCGSAGGMPVPNEPAPKPGDERREIVEDARSAADRAVVEIVQAKGQGSVPGNVARKAAARVTKPELSWDQELMCAARQVVNQQAGRDDYSWSVPNRWANALQGMNPRPVLPGMVQMVAEVAFVFDTSGSIGDEQLNLMLGKAAGLLRSLAGARVTMIAADAKVQSLVRVASVEQMRGHMKGGGGTSFVPAFKALERFRPRPDLVVYATDGYGEYPKRAPFRTIWLQTPGGRVTAAFGKVVQMRP